MPGWKGLGKTLSGAANAAKSAKAKASTKLSKKKEPDFMSMYGNFEDEDDEDADEDDDEVERQKVSPRLLLGVQADACGSHRVRVPSREEGEERGLTSDVAHRCGRPSRS